MAVGGRAGGSEGSNFKRGVWLERDAENKREILSPYYSHDDLPQTPFSDPFVICIHELEI